MAQADPERSPDVHAWFSALCPAFSRGQRRASRVLLVCCLGALVGGIDIIDSAHARAAQRFEPPPPRPAKHPDLARQAPRETAIRNPRLTPVPRPRLAPIVREP